MALSKGTATDYLDLVDELDAFLVADHVATVAINAAGTGYAVDDVLTVAGGTTTHAAQIIVTSVSSGAITGARIYDSGAYSADPTLTANAVTGGSGSGASFNLTMESDPWTVRISQTIETTEEVRLYEGSGGSGVFVGFRTYQEDTGARQARNWALFGCSSYNSGLDWYEQPNITSLAGFSFVDGTLGTAQEGQYMVLKDNDGFPINYWFYVTNRRIIVVAKLFDAVTSTPRYAACYLGLLNPVGTSAEFPYPLYVAGCAGDSRTAWDDLAPAFHFTGLTQAVGVSSKNGPGAYFAVDGTWKDVKNSDAAFGGSTRTERNLHTVYPCGQPSVNLSVSPNAPKIVDSPGNGLQWDRMIAMDGSFSTPADFELWPTPDSTTEKRLLVPVALQSSAATDDYMIVGELDGVYWTSAAGTTTATSEDTIEDADSGEVYVFFQNGTYSQLDGYQLFRES